jgi:hypothetical protein
MGEILFRSKLSDSMFRGLAPWMDKLPGRLLHTNVVGCTIFAAVSGSSAATCATIGKMTLPELGKRGGYPDDMAIGSLAGRHAGPADSAVHHHDRLRRGGRRVDRQAVHGRRAPGLLLAGCSWLYRPGRCSTGTRCRRPTCHELQAEDLRIAPPDSGGAADRPVLGGIYSGIATATEAAAVGVAGSLAVGHCRGADLEDLHRRPGRHAACTA